MRPDRFSAYVDGARNGRTGLWRIILSLVVIAIVWTIGTVVVFGAGCVAMSIRDGQSLSNFDDILDGFGFQAATTDPAAAAMLLLSVASLWIGVWLASRLAHGRSIASVLGAARRLYWRDFVRSGMVSSGVMIAAFPIGFAIDPDVMRGEISLGGWLLALVPMLVCCLLQTSAEELAFRGYLHQQLAARYAMPAIWLGLPTALFTLLHWDAEASSAMNAAILASILAFSLGMTNLLVKTGNLGASIGAHFANNVSAFMLISSQPNFGGAALFAARSIYDPGWTTTRIAMLGLLGVSTVCVTQFLLLHRSSPVRLRSLR